MVIKMKIMEKIKNNNNDDNNKHAWRPFPNLRTSWPEQRFRVVSLKMVCKICFLSNVLFVKNNKVFIFFFLSNYHQEKGCKRRFHLPFWRAQLNCLTHRVLKYIFKIFIDNTNVLKIIIAWLFCLWVWKWWLWCCQCCWWW